MAINPVKFGCAWVSFNKDTNRPEFFVGTIQSTLVATKGILQFTPTDQDIFHKGDMDRVMIRSYYQPGPLAPDRIRGIHVFVNLRFSGSIRGRLELGLGRQENRLAFEVPYLLGTLIFLGRDPSAYKTRKIHLLGDKLTLTFGAGLSTSAIPTNGEFRVDGIDVDTEEMFEGNLND